ncbi:uncharacterized protein N7482_009791 [Penicillium canariense]|uniref:rRNA adenine N(6)-methyltransferase n=1 Tax=Penicillium canariense TaxID=189055 RepID=A0A9W9HQS4_9EURO|nr:uncharacterized protein N7482_009791 [Penicillium canariense]KAJ5153313.1 hypothetical protein N7482_009791 [Penicillium canariense]
MSISKRVLAQRWMPVEQYPITKAINSHVLKKLKRRTALQSSIVSDELCADVLQRVSPYLSRSSPIDVLDLWPNTGNFSSKINDYLRPRRHVLIEPDLPSYEPFLKQLVDTSPSYKLLSMDLYTKADWGDVFEEHFPEQVSSHKRQAIDQILPKNDTLLVLASPPLPAQKADHYTPQRWWSAMMEACMQQKGIHRYGSVRILASIPSLEVEGIVPRTVGERRRPALLTETVALHALEVASPYEEEASWVTLKPLDVTIKGRERVAERTAAQKIITPSGREPPPLELAPVSLKRERSDVPHSPRILTERHKVLLADIEAGNKEDPNIPITKSAAKTARQKAQSAFYKENKIAHSRLELAHRRVEIDQTMRALSRAAADPSKTVKDLEQLDNTIAAQEAGLADQYASMHHRLYKSWDRFVDDYRTMNVSNNFDDSVLLWDQRPWEPLRIDKLELFPREPRSIMYFEAEANPVYLQKISHLSDEKRGQIFGLFEALSLVFGPRNHITVGELFKILFLDRPTNELLQAIPGLVPFAMKRLKPGSGPIPLAHPTVDPNACFQENLNYDVGDVRLRCIPIPTLWDILLEYQKQAPDTTAIQFSRMIGATLTSFRAGRNLMVPPKRLH